MAGIVLYHVLLHAVPESESIPILAAVKTVFHVGVPCFVMLSGWFGIRPSVHGFLGLWSMCLFYSLLLRGVSIAISICEPSPHAAFFAFVPLLSGEWWFFTVYATLYFCAPVLQTFANKSSSREVWHVVIALFVLSFWLGHSPGVKCMAGGKNILHFAFLYLLGNRLRNIPPAVPWLKIAAAGFALVATLLSATTICHGGLPSRIYEDLFFAYNSPGLTVLAVLVFFTAMRMPFGSMERPWHDARINFAAKSVFPIYLLHVNGSLSPLFYRWLHDVAFTGKSPPRILLTSLAVSAGILVGCLIVDIAMRPLRLFFATAIEKSVAASVAFVSRRLGHAIMTVRQ